MNRTRAIVVAAALATGASACTATARYVRHADVSWERPAVAAAIVPVVVLVYVLAALG